MTIELQIDCPASSILLFIQESYKPFSNHCIPQAFSNFLAIGMPENASKNWTPILNI